jgi:hypothetical protein
MAAVRSPELYAEAAATEVTGAGVCSRPRPFHRRPGTRAARREASEERRLWLAAPDSLPAKEGVRPEPPGTGGGATSVRPRVALVGNEQRE